MTEPAWRIGFTDQGWRQFELVPPAYRDAVIACLGEMLADDEIHCAGQGVENRRGFSVKYQVDEAAACIWITGIDHLWRMDQPRWGLVGPGLISG